MTRALAFAFAVVAVALAPRVARAQQGAFRFEISAVGDSTISFRVGDVTWVKPGLKGIAVDPAHRDALVARFSVLRVSGALATAVVTGQTARITADDFALLEPPAKQWYQQPAVWIGAAAGVLAGVLIAH